MSSNTGEESAKSNHKVARKQWRNNDMEDAMKAVAEVKMTVTTAAWSFKVPRKTLDDRIKGRVCHPWGKNRSSNHSFARGGKFPDRVHEGHGKLWFSLDADYGKGICVGHCQMLWQ